jgi:hypothetical protein
VSNPLAEQAPPAQVPIFNREPVASLALWTLEFSAAGTRFTIPAHPASLWMSLLMEPISNLDFIRELLEPEDVYPFVQLYLYEDVDLDTIMCDLLEAASGRKWWVALRLVSAARHSWHHVGASLLIDGVRPDQLSLAAWLDAFTFKFLQAVKPEQAVMWSMEIEMPPDGVEVAEDELEMSRSQFLSLE